MKTRSRSVYYGWVVTAATGGIKNEDSSIADATL